jgi:F-box protein 21
LEQISEMLDRLALQLRREIPEMDHWSPRRKALATAHFLRINNLTGIASEVQYRDLQNNYIGLALQDDDHPSLPLISVAIFCGVAQRLGLKAYCNGFPGHVYAIVYPDPGMTLDRKPLTVDEEIAPPLYLDPYRSDIEVPVEDLETQLRAWGISLENFQRFLGISSIRHIVLRTSRNIVATVQGFTAQEDHTENPGHSTIRLHANPFADMDNAFYSAVWANFLLCSRSPGPESTEMVHFLPLILERFEKHYPMDANLIERYVCPYFRNVEPTISWQLFETLRVVRAGDCIPKQIRARHESTSADRVVYHIGQVFKHRRYGYTAVITGWDIECSQTSQWMSVNQVDRLDKGRQQSFYHAL